MWTAGTTCFTIGLATTACAWTVGALFDTLNKANNVIRLCIMHAEQWKRNQKQFG